MRLTKYYAHLRGLHATLIETRQDIDSGTVPDRLEPFLHTWNAILFPRFSFPNSDRRFRVRKCTITVQSFRCLINTDFVDSINSQFFYFHYRYANLRYPVIAPPSRRWENTLLPNYHFYLKYRSFIQELSETAEEKFFFILGLQTWSEVSRLRCSGVLRS